MFENIVDSWTEKETGILEDLIQSLKDGDYLNRIMILNSDLSDFTKNYLLYEFDEESSHEDLKSRISKSNKLYFNYTLRPKWTLQTFLFNNFESRPPNEILKKLNIFTFYNYYSESIKDAMKDNFQIFITKSELTSIINSVDLSIYEKLSKDINSLKIKNFFLQLFLIRCEKESEYNLESKIPYSFIKIFLEDKSYPDYVQKFSVVKDLDSLTELSLKDITKILTDKYNITESPERKETSVDEDGSDKSDKKTEYEKIEIDEDIIKKDIPKEEEIELNPIEDYDPDPEIVFKPIKEIKRDKIDVSENFNEPEVFRIIKKVEGNKKDLDQNDKAKKTFIPLKKDKSDLTSKKEEKDLEKNNKEEVIESKKSSGEKNEISLLFDEKRSEKILKKIYKSDLLLMEMSFTKLKECNSWEDASSQLKQVFRRNDVDIYNKDVVFFVDKLNEYFKKK